MTIAALNLAMPATEPVGARPRPGRSRLIGVAGAALLLTVAPAIAQSVPSTARPEIAPEALTPPSRPATPGLEVAPAPASTPPAGAEAVTFTLAGIQLEGGTVYGPAELDEFYAGKIGTTVSLADVFGIAAAIEARYRADGYFLTRVVVPAQRIEGGVVQLAVVEGYIKSVAVVGDAGGARELVEAMAGKIAAGTGPARLETVERQLLLINDLPGLTARSTLSPVAGERGASQLTVEVTRKAFDGFAAIDNRSSEFLGPWSITLGAAANSFTPFAERVQLVLFSSIFDDRQQMAQLSGESTLNAAGLKLRAYASYAPGDPGGRLEPLDIETEATRFGLSLSYPVLRGRRLSVTTSVAFDWLDEDDTILDAPQTEDSLRVLRAFAEGEYRDELAGVTKASLGLHFGTDLFGASESTDPSLSRVDADGTFNKVTLDISRLQHLVSFDIGSLDLYLAVAGQWADGPLLADEEYRLGGYRFGRGYAPGEITGDQALAGSIELQFSGVIDETTEQGRFNLPYQLYAFYDAGKAWDIQRNGNDTSYGLTSAGAGVRLFIEDVAQAEIEVAKPLTRDRGDRNDDERRPAVFFRLVGSF